MHYVYILEDNVDRRWYIGYSANPRQRLLRHRSKNVRSTKNLNHFSLIYLEGYQNKHDALGRERFLKSGAGRRFLKKQLRHYLSPLIPNS